MAEDSGWCTIESSPAVFTEILQEIGAKDIQVDEPYSLDREELQRFGKVHGVIFLFRYRGNENEHAKTRSGEIITTANGLFFASQTIQNACATQAILSIVLNASIDIGTELKQFKEFTGEMDPMMKGMVLSNSETIRAAHNSFAVQQALIVDDPSAEKQDAFHFVSYIPWKGRVYELDGLQQGPRDIGPIETDDWIDVVSKDVSERVKEYSSDEIRFGLLVVTDDQRVRLDEQLVKLQAENAPIDQINEVTEKLAQQQDKRALWAKENARRKWNFMPFIVDFIKLLAETGHAKDIYKKATENKKQAFQKALDAKKAEQMEGFKST